MAILSVLINQFVTPTFCLCFPFTGINLPSMLHHVCDVSFNENQSELINVGAKID